MAIIKFENSEDLINYLCRKDVLGKLEINFEPDFGAIVPHLLSVNDLELRNHLEDVFSMWTWTISSLPPSGFKMIMYGTKDFDLKTRKNEEVGLRERYNFKDGRDFELNTDKLKTKRKI